MIARLRQETVERLAELPAFRSVLDSRQVQLRRPMLPAIRVYTSVSGTNVTLNIVEFRNAIRLVVQVIAEDRGDAANAAQVDDLCLQVKTRLLCDPTWMLLFERVLSLETELEGNVEGESRTVIATMAFTLQESEVYEPIIPDWLDRVNIKLDVIRPAADPNIRYPGPDGRIEVAAEVALVERPSTGPTVWDEEDPDRTTVWDNGDTEWPT